MDILNMTDDEKKKKFKELAQLCNDVCEENLVKEGEMDWTQDDIDMFVSQFQQSQEDEEKQIVDMKKLDPHFIPYEKYQEKYSGFDEEVIRTMWELDNKKLEDLRIPPLRIVDENIELVDNLSSVKYIDAEKESITETETECITKANCDASGEDLSC